MKKFPVLGLAVLMVLGACQDRENGQLPTEISVPSAPSLSASAGESNGSTVCDTHQETLAELKTKLVNDPNNTELAEQVAAYEAIVLDTCE